MQLLPSFLFLFFSPFSFYLLLITFFRVLLGILLLSSVTDSQSLLFPSFSFFLRAKMTFRSVFTVLVVLVAVVRAFHSSHLSQQRIQRAGYLRMNHDGLTKKLVHSLTAGFLAFNVMTADGMVARADQEVTIPNVPVYNKKSSDLIPYVNVERGFRLFRPFGWNEFEGQGGGYAVKFASLISSDENVVVGSAPATAGKSSITDYGTLESLGEKLAKKRTGTLVKADARNTDGTVFYSFQFENPLDDSLPRIGRPKPTKGVELYELCVAKGRLWSVQATSNDRDFPAKQETLRNSLLSFSPRM